VTLNHEVEGSIPSGVTMEMMEASRQYQDLLEAHRVDPDDEATWDELQKAKTTLEVVWLEVQMN
jgi:hypothetical protein